MTLVQELRNMKSRTGRENSWDHPWVEKGDMGTIRCELAPQEDAFWSQPLVAVPLIPHSGAALMCSCLDCSYRFIGRRAQHLRQHFLFFFFILFFLHLWVFCVHEYLCTVCMPWPNKPQEGLISHRTGVTDGSQFPCECWELDPRSPEGQLVFWTGESSL